MTPKVPTIEEWRSQMELAMLDKNEWLNPEEVGRKFLALISLIQKKDLILFQFTQEEWILSNRQYDSGFRPAEVAREALNLTDTLGEKIK